MEVWPTGVKNFDQGATSTPRVVEQAHKIQFVMINYMRIHRERQGGPYALVVQRASMYHLFQGGMARLAIQAISETRDFTSSEFRFMGALQALLDCAPAAKS